MVGQESLLKDLRADDAPFTIVVGPAGCGKNMAVRESSESPVYCLPDLKVETVRKMIEDAHSTRTQMLYLIPDADNMSVIAKNSLLKFTEEPPKYARVVMTLEQEHNTLETIWSRARVLHYQPYTRDQLATFVGPDRSEWSEIIVDASETPGDVLGFLAAGEDLWNFVVKVAENIHKVRGANAMKISDQICLKSGEDKKFDLKLFLRLFEVYCARMMFRASISENKRLFCRGIQITSDALSNFRINGINKQFLFDHWMFEIRSAWREQNGSFYS